VRLETSLESVFRLNRS